MSVQHDLRSFIVARPAVATLTNRVVRNEFPQTNQLPAVRYQRTGANDDVTQDGAGGLTETVFVIDCFGTTQDQADSLADAVRTALRGYAGTMGATTVRAIFIRDTADDYTPFPEGSDLFIPFTSMDAHVWHV